jgi:hypothetical protein
MDHWERNLRGHSRGQFIRGKAGPLQPPRPWCCGTVVLNRLFILEDVPLRAQRGEVFVERCGRAAPQRHTGQIEEDHPEYDAARSDRPELNAGQIAPVWRKI